MLRKGTVKVLVGIFFVCLSKTSIQHSRKVFHTISFLNSESCFLASFTVQSSMEQFILIVIVVSYAKKLITQRNGQ